MNRILKIHGKNWIAMIGFGIGFELLRNEAEKTTHFAEEFTVKGSCDSVCLLLPKVIKGNTLIALAVMSYGAGGD